MDLPEVTFVRTAIATGARASQHGRMRSPLASILRPLTLAGLCTLFAVGLSLRWLSDGRAAAGWAVLAAFTVAFLLHDAAERRHAPLGHALLVLQAVLALALLALVQRIGTAPVLLVVWTAAVAIAWPPRTALLAVVAVNVAAYAILVRSGHPAPLITMMLYVGFEGFAALCAYYARSAEQSRDALARVNADLLATRALLADSARDAERLRVARELHDVAGHKLTALTLNLRALATDPAMAARAEVRIAQQLAAELLGDIRGIVQAIRDARGLDLATALRALAAPLPRPRLELDIDERVRIDDTNTADTVLRIVQEALTNAARHANADVLAVSLRQEGACLRIDITDDGRMHGAMREGNGLCGMRERVTQAGGTLDVRRSARGSLAIAASLPL